MTFETLDSGERQVFSGGMQRDTSEGKMRPDLMIPLHPGWSETDLVQITVLLGLNGVNQAEILKFLRIFLEWRDEEESASYLFLLMVERSGPLLKRFAELLARGGEKYDDRNWEKAEGEEELKRFEISAFRHFIQYLSGDEDEDHAAAVIFNVRGRDWLRKKIEHAKPRD